MENGIVLEDQIRAFGKDAYSTFAIEALTSEVPTCFYDLSSRVSLDLFPEASMQEIAETLLGTSFDTHVEAVKAIRYAEAVSQVRKINLETEVDEDGPMIDIKDLEQAYLLVGLTMFSDGAGDEEIKLTVNEFFEDPLNRFRIEGLAQMLEVEKPQVH